MEAEGHAASARHLPAGGQTRAGATSRGGLARLRAALATLLTLAATTALTAVALPALADEPVPTPDEMRVLGEDRTDSKRLEKELQKLNWEQFRSVIEAIPKLKADVDAYGAAGWTFVKGRYQSYPWHRNIDKLDAEERQHLATLIDNSRATR